MGAFSASSTSMQIRVLHRPAMGGCEVLYLPWRHLSGLPECRLEALEKLAHDEHRLAPRDLLAEIGHVCRVYPAAVPESLCQGLFQVIHTVCQVVIQSAPQCCVTTQW